MIRIPLVIALGLLSPLLQAQWIHQPTPGIPRTADGNPDLSAPAARTADGKPDLSGLWTFAGAGGGLSQLKPPEIKPWAEALHKEREENFFRDSPDYQCLPNPGIGGLTKVVQTPGLIVVLSEDLTYRQIFPDGRELPMDPNPAWMGYSVGRWEDDTLVVESTGYNDRTWLARGYPHSENLHITERWRRADFGHLTVEVSRSDPAIYAKPWTSKVVGAYTADTDLIEYVCAENEKDRVHLVGKQSDDTKNAVKLAPEILSGYVGAYEFSSKELTSDGVYTFNVALRDGVLEASMDNRGKIKLTALSPTRFVWDGFPVVFEKDENGKVTRLVWSAPDGDYRADRKK
jgi:hypothetical protein